MVRVDQITAGALVRKELRKYLATQQLNGSLEYREIKGFLDSTFVIKADRSTWLLIFEACHAWKDFA